MSPKGRRLVPFNQIRETQTIPYKDPENQRKANRRWREANLEKARAREAAYRAAMDGEWRGWPKEYYDDEGP